MKYSLLIDKMIEYFNGDSKRVQHFLKVFSFAETISKLENLDDNLIHIIKTASIVHDIGIKISEIKYNSSDGKYQEKEGPAIAEKMLSDLNFDPYTIKRVCWLVAHHHTYHSIDSIDHQILVEADFLVNMCEEQMSIDSIRSIYSNIFRTDAGKKICKNLFKLDDIIDENKDHYDEEIVSPKRTSNTILSFKEVSISPAYMIGEKCNGCGTCIDVCPAQCIESKRTPVYIRQEDCLHCGSCADVCIKHAIIQISK